MESICLMSARSLTNSVLKDSVPLFENISLSNKSLSSDTLSDEVGFMDLGKSICEPHLVLPELREADFKIAMSLAGEAQILSAEL